MLQRNSKNICTRPCFSSCSRDYNACLFVCLFNSSSRGFSSRHWTADSFQTPRDRMSFAFLSPNNTGYTGFPRQQWQDGTVCVGLIWVWLPAWLCLWPLPIDECHRDVTVGMLISYGGKWQGAGGRYIVLIASIVVFLTHLWVVGVVKGRTEIWMCSG